MPHTPERKLVKHGHPRSEEEEEVSVLSPTERGSKNACVGDAASRARQSLQSGELQRGYGSGDEYTPESELDIERLRAIHRWRKDSREVLREKRKSYWHGTLPGVDDGLADEGEIALRTLQRENPVAHRYLVNLLRGETGCWDDLLRGRGDPDGRIDGSFHDRIALSRLYEIVVFLGREEPERARDITLATFEEYVEEHRVNADGDVRKWLRYNKRHRESYRAYTLDKAVEDADRAKFQRFLNRTEDYEEEWRAWGDTYSDTTTNCVRFALDFLTGVIRTDSDLGDLREHAAKFYDLDLSGELLQYTIEQGDDVQDTNPPGPGADGGDGDGTRVRVSQGATGDEVVELAQELDSGRDNADRTYRTALQRLQNDGVAKMAFCPSRPNGERFVYLPAHRPEPEDARWVKLEGEKREPEPAEPETPEEPEIMTDGGISEAEIREEYGEVVVSTNSKSSKSLHIPEGSGEEPRPLCGKPLQRKEWRRKSVDVYPPGWFSWCQSCQEELRESEESEATDERESLINEHGVCEGAARAEWTD